MLTRCVVLCRHCAMRFFVSATTTTVGQRQPNSEYCVFYRLAMLVRHLVCHLDAMVPVLLHNPQYGSVRIIMAIETNTEQLVERLFAVGAHFGFTKSRRHPSMASFIFGNKQGTDIFNLEDTAAQIAAAKEALYTAGEQGKTVLFVGTKDEVAKQVRAQAEAIEMPYVTNRWIGGMLTNFTEIKKRVERLKTLVAEREGGELDRKYTKKERVVIGREIDKLTFNFDGIKNMDRTPALMVVVDPRHDHIAVTEANDMKVPVIGIMGSDCDANRITYPIAMNDALTASVDLVTTELAQAYAEGKKNYTPAPVRSPRGADRGSDNRGRRPRTDRRPA